MGKKGVILTLLIILSLFFNLVSFVNITNINFDKEATESSYRELLAEVESLRARIDELEKKNEELMRSKYYLEDLTNANNRLIKEQIKLMELKNNWSFLRENEVLPIYDGNVNSYSREIALYISFPKSLTLEEKLREICSKLSQYCFNGLPIELKEIKDIEGKSVAVINLRESPINEEIAGPEEMIGHSWATYYFQGSTGGVLTSVKLVETFLQRDYRGPWIDGVQFLYEGNQIDFEHVEGLREINYR